MSERAAGTGRWRAAAVVLVLLAVGSVVLAVTRTTYPDPDRLWGNSTRTSPTGEWRRVADAPLSPRSNSLLAWTGTEVLVISGDQTSPCPPTANCIADPDDRALVDGAAFDPSSGTWRPIADAPMPLSWGGNEAFVDGILYLGKPDDPATLLTYDVEANAWGELPAPPLMPARTLLADGDRLLAPLGMTAGLEGDVVDLAYDAGSGEWTPLPIDPIRDAQARQMQAVDGRLYLIAGSLDEDDEEAQGMSAIVHAAVLRDGAWTQLPDPNTDGYLPSLATDELILSPQDDETAGDGDDVPGYWALDTTTDEWVDVPEVPSAPGPNVAGAWEAGDHHLFVSEVVLDDATRTWAPLGAPDELEREGLQAVTMGDRLFVFGGAIVDGDRYDAYAEAEQQRDAWIWTPA